MKLPIAVVGAWLAVAGAAEAAEISATATLTSDYDWRGVTQTQGDPAFQLGLNYAAESGVYMGIWGSNVDFDTPNYGGGNRPATEIDAYFGYAAGDPDDGLGYDVGAIYYSYPNATVGNFPEVYAGISKGPFSLKGWYSWDFFGAGETAYYADSAVTVPMASGFSFLAHLGYSAGKFWKDGAGEYLDWSLGIGYDVGGASLSFKYVDGSDLDSDPRNLGRFVFSISTTLGGG